MDNNQQKIPKISKEATKRLEALIHNAENLKNEIEAYSNESAEVLKKLEEDVDTKISQVNEGLSHLDYVENVAADQFDKIIQEQIEELTNQ